MSAMTKNTFLILFPIAIMLLIAACERPTKAINDTAIYGWDEYKNPVITRVSLHDTVSKKFTNALNIASVNGIKASYPSGKYTAYFEYKADPEKVLNAIGRLPFKTSNAVSDTTCRALALRFSLSGKLLLSVNEIKASSFFWNINPQDFFYYECLKAPERHTILINKITGMVLHRIESVS